MNVVILRGTLSSDPVERVLPSGTSLVQYEVTTRVAEGPAASVPVAWFDPPAAASSFAAGVEVVVTGQVRRRFFRAGGSTASRTEVVAHSVVPAGQKKKAGRAVAAALAGVA
ncbi:MAG: single-stranded DNA-binding protein [Acidimicrobiales bacterium]|nr:single-stranded DNA-binding protein [Acidimicrobiales bacterium]